MTSGGIEEGGWAIFIIVELIYYGFVVHQLSLRNLMVRMVKSVTLTIASRFRSRDWLGFNLNFIESCVSLFSDILRMTSSSSVSPIFFLHDFCKWLSTDGKSVLTQAG
jgi:hypothetical protein